MVSTASGIVTDVRLEQFLNAESTILVRLAGNSTDANSVQPLKALPPIFVTPSGITIELKLVQPLKAESPIFVRVSGNSTDFKFVQPENALFSIDAKPVKYFNSLNEVIVVLSLKIVPNEVTAPNSLSLNSSSPFLSHLATRTDFTFASSKSMILVSSTSFTPPLKISSVQPAAIYASFVPAGTGCKILSYFEKI